MKPGDTSIGGPGRSFPSTVWSAIEEVQGLSEQQAREKVGRILAAYWKPVYVAIRAGWSRGSEDAKDLTQSFFAFLLDGDVLHRVRRGRGRFRGFLKASLRNFLANDHRADAALKRGGAETLVSLEAAAKEIDENLPSPAGRSPEQIFDNEWARALFQGAIEDFERGAQDPAMVRVFRLFQEASRGDEGPVYERIAAKTGLSRNAVEHHLQRAREAIRDRVLARIREYAADDIELQQELELIRGAWA